MNDAAAATSLESARRASSENARRAYVPWFTRDQYRRIHSYLEDGNRLPKRYPEWRRAVDQEVFELTRQGQLVELVPFQLTAFRRWAQSAGRRTTLESLRDWCQVAGRVDTTRRAGAVALSE